MEGAYTVAGNLFRLMKRASQSQMKKTTQACIHFRPVSERAYPSGRTPLTLGR